MSPHVPGKTVLALDRETVKSVMTMKEAIDVVEAAYADLSAGRAQSPLRTCLDVQGGHVFFMPCHLEGMGYAAVKMVSSYPGNPARGLPTVSALVTVIDPETGIPLAIMDGGYLTALRTGASGAVAAKYLARKDAKSVALFGAGVQAWTQMEGVCAVRPVERIKVWDPRLDAAREFVARARDSKPGSPEIEVAASWADALRDADLIITATTSGVPVFDGRSMRTGTHITGVGSYTAETRELDTYTMMKASKVVVDSRESALAEAGDILIPIKEGLLSRDSVYAEIGEIILGVKSGRQDQDEITVFKAVGVSALDAAVGGAVYGKALEMGMGVSVPIF